MGTETRRGTRIRELRKRRNLTQEELSARSGLSVDTLSALENEDGIPRLDTLESLAAAYGLRVGDLLNALDDPDDSPRARTERTITDLCRQLDDRTLEMVRAQVSAVVEWGRRSD